ncbi:hypothetical protein O181_087710 [Austropuccinia psidii MF-1]|uniref:Reverse transcriptase Ty1/copia-type domain-containing protein n=1 Tax=Austropuccinia psidii MF-1 TaxID=1389203 RepID=A0A9Q3IQ57_9BASI|nr:hypothetical protein [Austropuccinia psidii MF-1]
MEGVNVSAAYLYSLIEEDIFVQAPVELQLNLAGNVMKLNKALYGTKPAAISGALDSFKAKIMSKLKIQWLDCVTKIVGLIIGMENGKLDISQPLLTKQLLNDYHFPIRDQFTTLLEGQIFTNNRQLVDQTHYKSVLGSPPDITLAFNLLARFSSNPGLTHWEALDHLMGYLCRHQHQPLIYDRKDQGLPFGAMPTRVGSTNIVLWDLW